MKHRRLILIALVGFIGFVSGGWLLQGPANASNNERQRARIFDAVLRYVAQYYVDSVDVSQLYDMATEGMLRQLQDPYTSFLRQTGFEELSISTTGNYGGVGLRIETRDGWIQVVAPIADGPGERAGIDSGDRIVEVEGASTRGWSTERAASLLRGEPGTEVSIMVRRAGFQDSLPFTLTRAAIHVNSVEGAMLIAPGVGYLRLTTVSSESAAELFKAIDDLRGQGATSMILDLRNNPGGLLEQGVALADLFLDPGDVVVETRGRARGATETFTAGQREAWPDMPLALLVNGATASAAEILSGALQDHDRAIAVGTPTFGKGVAYLLIPLTDSEALTVTSSRWYTPSGRSIQRGVSGSRALGLLASNAPPPDSLATMATAAQPVFRSDAGRVLDAGDGGIQPDVTMPRDTLTDSERAFVEAIGSRVGDYRNVMTRYALELAGQNAVTDPDFAVTDGMLATLLQGLRGTGFEVADSIFDGARNFVAEQFGYELTRYAFGRTAEIRRTALHDEQTAKAVELLQTAKSTDELLQLASRN